MIQTKIFCDRPGCKALLPTSRTVISIGSGNGKKADTVTIDLCDVHAQEARQFLDPPEAPKPRRAPRTPRSPAVRRPSLRRLDQPETATAS